MQRVTAPECSCLLGRGLLRRRVPQAAKVGRLGLQRQPAVACGGRALEVAQRDRRLGRAVVRLRPEGAGMSHAHNPAMQRDTCLC